MVFNHLIGVRFPVGPPRVSSMYKIGIIDKINPKGLEIFNSKKEEGPNLINPGDKVVFKEITLDQYKNYNEQ